MEKLLSSFPDDVDESMRQKVHDVADEKDVSSPSSPSVLCFFFMCSCSLVFPQASLVALHCLSILIKKALCSQGLTDRLRALSRENESLKKKNKEVAVENSKLKKKNSDLSSELASERAAHLDQVGVINNKVQLLGKEKDAVKRMLD